MACSNNTNKLSPQEPFLLSSGCSSSSNNTNKLSPQEPHSHQNTRGSGSKEKHTFKCSNNTNKLSPQELSALL